MRYKPCNATGCPNLVEIGVKYCDNHKNLEVKRKRLRNREYDRSRKDDKEWQFYRSKEWLITRNVVIKKYNSLDLYAYYVENKIVYASTIHHIVELREDWSKRLEISNLFPVSESTHKKIHILYENGKKEETQRLLRELLERYKEEFKEDVK